ncbi:MAG: hypothetical protein JWM28_1858 [Chitinophagaceae bacterium]|nr:hypothetical protein [Chitinophagaceae bacterium]
MLHRQVPMLILPVPSKIGSINSNVINKENKL